MFILRIFAFSQRAPLIVAAASTLRPTKLDSCLTSSKFAKHLSQATKLSGCLSASLAGDMPQSGISHK